jgi:4-carboxymuconolactone decarboxylase
MARIEDPHSRLDEEGHRVLGVLEGKRGRVDMYRAMCLNPELAEWVGVLGTYLRFGSGVVSDLERELVICRAGRRMDSPYEWVMHEPELLAAGLDPEAVATLRAGEIPSTLTEEQHDLVVLTDLVVDRAPVPRDLHDRIVGRKGETGYVELVVLVGFYGMIAAFIAATEVPLPEGVAPPF